MAIHISVLPYIRYHADMNPETLFKLLADPTRLRVMMLLRTEGSLCVCELTDALELSQPKISRHLAMLRDASVVVDERRGQWVHYHLLPELPDWVVKVLDAAIASEPGAALLSSDRLRLVNSAPRPSLQRCPA